MMSTSSEPFTEPIDTLCQASSAVNILDLPKARNPVISTIRFSKRFVLMGPNEQRIRELMAPQLLEFFENERVYHLESVGNELVIFETFMRRATVGEVQNMLGFAERLVAILASQAGKLPTANEEAAAG